MKDEINIERRNSYDDNIITYEMSQSFYDELIKKDDVDQYSEDDLIIDYRLSLFEFNDLIADNERNFEDIKSPKSHLSIKKDNTIKNGDDEGFDEDDVIKVKSGNTNPGTSSNQTDPKDVLQHNSLYVNKSILLEVVPEEEHNLSQGINNMKWERIQENMVNSFDADAISKTNNHDVNEKEQIAKKPKLYNGHNETSNSVNFIYLY